MALPLLPINISINFPFLKTSLFFNAESFGLEDEDQIKVSSHQLEKLAIVRDIYLKNNNIYRCSKSSILHTRVTKFHPRSLSLKFGKLEKTHLQLYDIPPLETTWFLKLQDYLGKITPHRSYSLVMNEPSESVSPQNALINFFPFCACTNSL